MENVRVAFSLQIWKQRARLSGSRFSIYIIQEYSGQRSSLRMNVSGICSYQVIRVYITKFIMSIVSWIVKYWIWSHSYPASSYYLETHTVFRTSWSVRKVNADFDLFIKYLSYPQYLLETNLSQTTFNNLPSTQPAPRTWKALSNLCSAEKIESKGKQLGQEEESSWEIYFGFYSCTGTLHRMAIEDVTT